jgi:cell division protease FtsH
MNSVVRPILFWALILIVGIGVYSFVEQRQETVRLLNLTDLLERAKRGEIAEVKITGSHVTGRLVQGNRTFESTLPQEYSPIYDRLTAANVKVTIAPPDQPFWKTPFVSWLVPILLAFGLGWLCATRARRMPTAA